jgi:hypothetical protein
MPICSHVCGRFGGKPAGLPPASPPVPLGGGADRCGERVWGGRNQLVVQITADGRHERAAGGVNLSDRQPAENLQDLAGVGGKNPQLKLICRFGLSNLDENDGGNQSLRPAVGSACMMI